MFTKSDLRTGYVVQYRNGDYALVMLNSFDGDRFIDIKDIYLKLITSTFNDDYILNNQSGYLNKNRNENNVTLDLDVIHKLIMSNNTNEVHTIDLLFYLSNVVDVESFPWDNVLSPFTIDLNNL